MTPATQPPPQALVTELVLAELVALDSNSGTRITEPQLDVSCLTLVLRIPDGYVQISLTEIAHRTDQTNSVRNAARQMLERMKSLHDVRRTSPLPPNTAFDSVCLTAILSRFDDPYTHRLALHDVCDRISAEPSGRAIATLGLLINYHSAGITGGLADQSMELEIRTLLVKSLDRLNFVDCSDYVGSEDFFLGAKDYDPSTRSSMIIANRAASAAISRGVAIDLP
jgi:hypothetical protein